MNNQPQQLDLFAQCDLVNPTINADQYQLQHAHSQYPMTTQKSIAQGDTDGVGRLNPSNQ